MLTTLNVAELKEAVRARYQREAMPVCSMYGLDAEQDKPRVQAIIQAQRRLEVCQGCNGLDCLQSVEKYHKPEIDSAGEVIDSLCEVYVTQEAAKKLPRRYAKKTFDDYEATSANAQALAKTYIFFDEGGSLYFHGACGTGKTFLASLIAKECIRRGQGVIFGNVPLLLDEIKKTFNDPQASSQVVLRKYIRCDLLIMDDLGTGVLSDWSIGEMYKIIDGRYNAEKPTIFTSNYSIEGLEARFSAKDKTAAQRIASRLRGMCSVADLGNRDRRVLE
ncbi:MAG: ATP-binding protein [Quinella sp. 1Q5]|nr:ATP-binding protein [Quinella sp. 1Q5]